MPAGRMRDPRSHTSIFTKADLPEFILPIAISSFLFLGSTISGSIKNIERLKLFWICDRLYITYETFKPVKSNCLFNVGIGLLSIQMMNIEFGLCEQILIAEDIFGSFHQIKYKFIYAVVWISIGILYRNSSNISRGRRYPSL